MKRLAFLHDNGSIKAKPSALQGTLARAFGSRHEIEPLFGCCSSTLVHGKLADRVVFRYHERIA